MRKLLFLALLFFIYYIAVMYKSAALMVLFLTQILLMVVMLFLSRYLGKHLNLSFSEKIVHAEKGLPFTWRFQIQNDGRLPISKFMVRFWKNRRKLYGSSDCDEHFISYQDTLEHCGVSIFYADRLKVFDYLSLFSAKQNWKDEMRVIVFPPRLEMQIEIELAAMGEENWNQNTSLLQGDDYEEIWRIREYQVGDTIRHIHWNQTARTEQIWVKEYGEEVKGRTSLFLDLKDRQNYSTSDMDAFYTLLYALLLGLLQKVSSVQVCWRREKKLGLSGLEVREESQCQELLIQLYYAAELDMDEESDFSMEREEELYTAMRLSLELSWFVQEKLIFHFSKEKLIEELTHRDFKI